MARPRKQPQFEPDMFHQSPRARFLESGLRCNSLALRLLATTVYQGKVSVQDWAKVFNVSATWVERWAQDAIDSWRAWESSASAPACLALPDPVPPGMRRYRPDRPACPPPVLESGKLDMEYPLPAVNPRLTQLFENGSTMSGAALDSLPCPTCGRKAIGKRRKVAKRLDDETARRNSKIECAAIYLLSRKSTDDLAKSHYVSLPTMHGWLKEAMGLLDLEMRPPGHQSPVKPHIFSRV